QRFPRGVGTPRVFIPLVLAGRSLLVGRSLVNRRHHRTGGWVCPLSGVYGFCCKLISHYAIGVFIRECLVKVSKLLLKSKQAVAAFAGNTCRAHVLIAGTLSLPVTGFHRQKSMGETY